MSASFHARQLGLASPRAYAGFGEFDFEFFVTKDGEVYRFRKALLGFGGDLFYFKYSGKTKNETGFFEGSPIEGDAAARIRRNSVGTWADLTAAKAEADKIASGVVAPTNVTTPGGDVVPVPVTPTPPATPPSKPIPWVPIAATSAAVIGLGVAFYFSSRSSSSPS